MINLINYMSPDRRKNLVEELKGQMIDIFEDFLAEKGIILEDTKPDDDVVIKGKDYDALSEKIEETLGNWGLFDDLEIATPAGNIIVFCADSEEPEGPYVAIDFSPKGSTDIIDLVLVTDKPTDKKVSSDDEKKDSIFLRVFGDPSNEDCTQEIEYTRKDLCSALDIPND